MYMYSCRYRCVYMMIYIYIFMYMIIWVNEDDDNHPLKLGVSLTSDKPMRRHTLRETRKVGKRKKSMASMKLVCG